MGTASRGGHKKDGRGSLAAPGSLRGGQAATGTTGEPTQSSRFRTIWGNWSVSPDDTLKSSVTHFDDALSNVGSR